MTTHKSDRQPTISGDIVLASDKFKASDCLCRAVSVESLLSATGIKFVAGDCVRKMLENQISYTYAYHRTSIEYNRRVYRTTCTQNEYNENSASDCFQRSRVTWNLLKVHCNSLIEFLIFLRAIIARICCRSRAVATIGAWGGNCPPTNIYCPPTKLLGN